MNKPRVNAEQAKMLKALGYDVPDTHYYEEHKAAGIFRECYRREVTNCNESYSFHYTRPTLDDAARWLREKKGWHVAVSTNEKHTKWICFAQRSGTYEPMEIVDSDNPVNDHDTALSEGITLILKKETN
jgi:hypothetical protein